MDLDHDARKDEDPPEDLNGDGMITTMRVKDPSGGWRALDWDPEIMVKASEAKGEQGGYRVMIEGKDNDQDGQVNEDPEGGVNANANFPFNYSRDHLGGGPFPVSEPEVRNVADFLYDRFNIYAVVGLGPQDNLSKPWSYKKLKQKDLMPKGGVQRGHKKSYQLLNQFYKEAGLKPLNPLFTQGEQAKGGHFLEWSYFHYGRLSISTPAWSPSVSNASSKNQPGDSTKEADSSLSPSAPASHQQDPRVRYAQWAKANLDSSGFLGWQAFDHPDFPYRTVEIGGFKPYARFRPPQAVVDSLAPKLGDFLGQLGSALPRPAFSNLKVYKLKEGLYRLEVDFYNEGKFPSLQAVAKQNKWVKKQTVALSLSDNQSLLAGSRRSILEPLRPNEHTTLRWLIKGKGKISLKAGAAQTGSIERSVALN
jgi:hypothetical protein